MKAPRNKNLLTKQRHEKLRVSADNILKQSKSKYTEKAKINEAKRIVSQKPQYVAEFERLLKIAENESDFLDAGHREMSNYAHGLYRMATWASYWIRQPEDWIAKSHNTSRQFFSLSRHLFAKYEIPAFMDTAWLKDGNPDGREQEWFIHIGNGGNIRKANKLPIPLTKMMAHHFLQAPDDFNINEAIRWGQIRGMGGSENLTKAIVGTQLKDFSTVLERPTGARILASCEPVTDWVNLREEFWQNVINFLIRNDNMLDMHQVGPIIDYINNQKFVSDRHVVGGVYVTLPPPQPGFSMSGRTMETLLTQVTVWHERLAKVKTGTNISWESCGIKGLDRIEGDKDSRNQKHYTITELLSSGELKEEGTKMKHCVSSYSGSCSMGRTAIYSLKADTGNGKERRLTIEINPKLKMITQARGKLNVPSNQLDQRLMSIWATQEGLTYGRGALGRWA